MINTVMPWPKGKTHWSKGHSAESDERLRKRVIAISIPLEEILAGKHPQYQSNKLRIKLLESGKKKHKCERCGISEWLGKPIALQLHHIDGDCHNHLLNNLEILCPNCHTQTDNWGNKTR